MEIDEDEIIRQAMSLIGKRRSEKKAEAVRENGKKGGAHVWTEASRQKLRDAQRVRREREKQEKEQSE